MADDLRRLATENRDYVVSLRRHFHTFPELSTKEFNTQEKIVAELTAMGLTPVKAAGTGVVADIKGARPGRTVAVRADMDALPIQDDCGQPYQSQTPGVCHACGHDGHTAMLLGMAKVLLPLRAELAGTVRLIFQPNEEIPPGGAIAVIEQGYLDGVDAIIGAHLWQPLPAGQLGLSFGRMMAQPGSYAIVIRGKGGHGSTPHITVDPILVGSEVVHALHTIVSRNIDPLEPAVISIGVFQAGHVYNVIPETARIEGTIRVFDGETLQAIHRRLEQIVKGVCEAYGAEYQFTTASSCPPLVNDAAVARRVWRAGAAVLGEAGVCEVKPVMGGED
ncbi:MAG TPA: amidohydrolase, partial [Negativicutes bacterium]|nr:amidohydrolase [Negativicutes bacterium]